MRRAENALAITRLFTLRIRFRTLRLQLAYLGLNLLHRPREHTRAVAEQAGVSGVMNIGPTTVVSTRIFLPAMTSFSREFDQWPMQIANHLTGDRLSNTRQRLGIPYLA
ncbi:MAG TPA: hypothetical protein VEX68_13165 [Bryobacteraceae bacterium]|nr:hypothetical protein [Bryobacteraceae bacterium]